jgi:hypothetical protein
MKVNSAARPRGKKNEVNHPGSRSVTAIARYYECEVKSEIRSSQAIYSRRCGQSAEIENQANGPDMSLYDFYDLPYHEHCSWLATRVLSVHHLIWLLFPEPSNDRMLSLRIPSISIQFPLPYPQYSMPAASRASYQIHHPAAIAITKANTEPLPFPPDIALSDFAGVILGVIFDAVGPGPWPKTVVFAVAVTIMTLVWTCGVLVVEVVGGGVIDGRVGASVGGPADVTFPVEDAVAVPLSIVAVAVARNVPIVAEAFTFTLPVLAADSSETVVELEPPAATISSPCSPHSS